MNKLQDILRLILTTSLSDREIGRSTGVSKNTARHYRLMCKNQGCTWDTLKELNLTELENRFNKRKGNPFIRRLPDFSFIHAELARPGVTLQLLWEEYRTPCPEDALSYSQFTHHYRRYRSSLKLTMRQVHIPGDKAFVDFSGKRPHYIDPETGEQVVVELFVGVLGHSNLTFALATRTQQIPDWIDANIQMLEYFGGCPRMIVPDNLKAAVTKPGLLPTLNRTYLEFADHYDVVVLPARKRHPKDKADVEVGVQITQRWVLARLRNLQFFSLESLNAEIRSLCEDLNQRIMKKLGQSRRERFEASERATLHSLPAERYEAAQWHGQQIVPPDYHVHVEKHWYSVPYQLIGERIETRATLTTIEVFHRGSRVASHRRSNEEGGHTTDPLHQPPSHRAYAERTPENMLTWASAIGPNLLQVVNAQFQRRVPEAGLPVCDALRQLARKYGNQDLERACARAVTIQSLTVKSVRSLLSTGRYKDAHQDECTQSELPLHHNVRGASYYLNEGEPTC